MRVQGARIISTCTVGIVLYALKGHKRLAQGNALGKAMLGCRPVRAKAS